MVTVNGLDQERINMTVKQELTQIKDALILTHFNVSCLVELIKQGMSEEEIEKAIKEIQEIKETIEECL